MDSSRRIAYALLASLAVRTPVLQGLITEEPWGTALDYEELDNRYPRLSGGQQALVDIALSIDGYKSVNLRTALASMDEFHRMEAVTAIADLVNAWRR